MKIFNYSLLAIVTLLFFVSSGRESYSQNLQVNFGVTFRNARLAPLWIPDEEGYFKKQKLDVKQVTLALMALRERWFRYDSVQYCFSFWTGGVRCQVSG
jgi:hypothetical protein